MMAKYLICLIVFGFFGILPVTVVTESISDSNVPSSARLDQGAETRVESPFKVVGDFTNVKSNGEHQSGYSVELWRQDNNIYGLISGDSSSRLIGDPPTGLLEEVKFNPRTGKLSFKAKVSLGQLGDDLPTREIYQFEGILTKRALTGNLRVINVFPPTPTQKKRITLRRSKESSLDMEQYPAAKTYAEWKNFADEILRFRGPRW